VEEQTDKTFIKNFSLVVVALTVFTFSIAFLARYVGFKEPEYNAGRITKTEENIMPIAGVYTGDAGTAAMQEVAAETEQAIAFEGSLDAEMIYNSVCSACHAAAVLGAPQPGSAEMAQRAEPGIDAMMQNALNGLNAMPARGGRPDLSDEQIQAVIEYMLQ
jgi:cytochrome c5